MKRPFPAAAYALAKNTLIILFLATLPLTATAQAPSGPLAEMWEIKVKDGHQSEFEDAFREHRDVRQQHNDPRPWDVYTPDTGPNLGHYAVRTCCFNWADQDAYSAWNQANPQVIGSWFEKVAAHVESVGHYYYEMDFANSHWPEGLMAPAMVGVTEFSLNAGKVAQFHEARTELSQIAINQGWAASGKHWSWSDRIGGEPTVDLVVPFSNYADMTPGDQQIGAFLVEHMGADKAAELLERFTSSVSSSSYGIWVHRPDLSSRKD